MIDLDSGDTDHFEERRPKPHQEVCSEHLSSHHTQAITFLKPRCGPSAPGILWPCVITSAFPLLGMRRSELYLIRQLRSPLPSTLFSPAMRRDQRYKISAWRLMSSAHFHYPKRFRGTSSPNLLYFSGCHLEVSGPPPPVLPGVGHPTMTSRRVPCGSGPTVRSPV